MTERPKELAELSKAELFQQSPVWWHSDKTQAPSLYWRKSPGHYALAALPIQDAFVCFWQHLFIHFNSALIPSLLSLLRNLLEISMFLFLPKLLLLYPLFTVQHFFHIQTNTYIYCMHCHLRLIFETNLLERHFPLALAPLHKKKSTKNSSFANRKALLLHGSLLGFVHITCFNSHAHDYLRIRWLF